MRNRDSLNPKIAPTGFEVELVLPPTEELNRQMYISVGGPWQWTERLVWTEDDWHQYVQRDVLETWLGRIDGETIGYFELEFQSAGDVEIRYFGLLPEFIGQGLGGALLTAAIQRAWSKPETRRLWLHTCTKDHEHALDNYCNRGFEVFKTEQG